MDLLDILKHFQRKYRNIEIKYVISLLLSILLFLLLLIVGLFINRLILLIFIPVVAIIIYKSEVFISLISISRKIESFFPEIKNKLIPSIELYRKFRTNQNNVKEGYSHELVDAAIVRTTESIKKLSLHNIINYKKTRISILICAILLIIFISIPVLNHNYFYTIWNLAFHPSTSPIKITIAPGNIYVNKDSVVMISYSINSPISNLRTTLHIKDQKFSNQGMAFTTKIIADSDFDYSLSIRSNLGVPIVKTKSYRISINKPIEINDILFTYYYPAYTHFATNTSRSVNIKVLKGTKVEFHGIASMPLQSAIRHSQNLNDSLTVTNNEFKGSFTITKDDSFNIILDGQNHRQGKSQLFYITTASDEVPFIKLFLPGKDIDVPVNMQALVGMYGLDDFGITRFDLCYTKPASGETVQTFLKSSNGKNEDTLFYLWDLTKLNILPGEAVNYYGVIYDNDAVSGNKSARSETYTIRFPTLNEIYDQANQENQATSEKLGPMAQIQEQLSKDLEKLSEHINQFRSLDWEEKTKLNQMLKKQEEILSDISNLQQEVNSTLSNMYSSLMLDQETLQRIREIGQILSEILPEQMKQNLEKLQQSLSEKNPDLTKMLENFKMSSDEMKEALKRAYDLLKNIQKEEQLKNMARKAEEIFKQQTQLNTRMNSEKPQKLATPQEQIGSEIKDLEDEIKQASESFEDSLVQAQLAEIAKELSNIKLSNQANNISKSLSQGNQSDSKKNASELLKDLERLKNQLKDLADRFKQDQDNMLTENLLKIAKELNDISQEQEKIKPINNITDLKELVLRQARISEATTLIAESIAVLSNKSLMVSPEWTKDIVKSVSIMDSASQVLEDAVHSNADARIAQQLQEQAILQIDIVTLRILLLTYQNQKSGGMPGGMESLLQALSQMTADQMMLGQQMGGMIPLPMPGGLSAAQMNELGRLMSQQGKLREALQKLLQEINSGKYGEMPGMTGSMHGALEDMKQIEKDISEQLVNRQTIERQEQTINHLLDAQRSIRQKEFTEKRESEVGKDYQIRPNIILDKNLGETKKLLREELLRALREGYPKEYEDMIKNYFESIIQE